MVSTTVRRIGSVLKMTGSAYFEDNISSLGAALAYYTVFAVTPLMMLTFSLASVIFDAGTARERILGEMKNLAGGQAAQAISTMQENATQSVNTTATVIGVATLLVGAFGVFMHLQDALNVIWHVEAKKKEHWLVTLKARIFSLGTVVGTGFILLVSLIMSAVLSWIGVHAAQRIGWSVGVLQVANFVFAFLVITFLFAMIFKLLPDTPVKWRDVWIGALMTSLLFNLGKWALGFYLSKVSSSYGVTGSLIALMVWAYYAAQIVFVGAEFTRVQATTAEGNKLGRTVAKHTPTKSHASRVR